MDLKLTPVAQELQVSIQTVKNWVKAFPAHFSDTAQRKTNKRYTPADMETLERINQFRQVDGLSIEEIKEILPVIPQDFEPEQTGEVQTQEVSQLMANMWATFEHQHNESMQAKNETIEVLREENKRLKKWRIGKG